MKLKYFSKTILLFLFLAPIVMCEGKEKTARNRLLPNQPVKARRLPVLLEIDRQDEILKSLATIESTTAEAPELLPNRVYLVYSEEENRWLWQVTDSDGEFPNPPEALRTLSVLPGSFVGAKNPNQRYGLNLSRAVWVRTFQPEQQFLWVYSAPPEKPKIKIVTYQPLPIPQEKKK